ncbi:hypothetical protein Ddc_14021 [Ditylenchus destructor]|nr:hypothetical protein Ddc_14021 [Ditylenchus destructor]
MAYFLPSNKPGMIAKMYFVCLILNGMKTLKTYFSIAMFAEVALFSAFQWFLWLSYLDQKEQETFKKVSTTAKSKSCADLNESAAPIVPV